MKKLSTLMPMLACLLMDAGAATYYSQGDLDPTLTTTWNSIRTGGGSNPANFSSGDIFIVQDGHEMTTSTTWVITGSGSVIRIESGGVLIGSHAIDLVGSSTFQIDDGGTYIHNNSIALASNLFAGTESFAPNSVFEYRMWPSGTLAAADYGHLTINNTVNSGNLQFGGGLTVVTGNLHIQNVFSGNEVRISSNGDYILTIGGNLVISGGTLNTANGTNALVSYNILLAGHYNQSGGTLTHGNTSSPLNFHFTGNGKTFTRTAGTLTGTNINWIINNGASITFNHDFSLAATRSFTMNSTSSLVIAPGATFTISGAADFNNQHVTLRSTISGTAGIGRITGTLAGATNVTVERFIGAVTPKRAWRLLSSPVSGTTINASWQEGVTSGNPDPGYGTHITGGAAVNGFDATGNASIKTYNGSWVTNTLTATNTGDITDHQSYMLFVRGDRSVNLSQGASAPAGNTTLRTTGTLRQGTFTDYVSVAANNYTLMGNPYPSTIDFELIHDDHNALVNFYTWDPYQSGSYGLGGYNFIERTGEGTYSVTPHGGSASANNNARYIPSGAAVLLQGPGSVVNVSLNESYKVSNTTSLSYFKIESTNANMAVNLLNTTSAVIDGIRVRYSNDYSNNITPEDAKKLNNNNENISIERSGQYFIVEKRKEITLCDTIHIRLTGMKQASYRLAFYPENLHALHAILYDSYLNTSTVISTSTETIIHFTVDGNAASSGNRFKIIVSPGNVLPLHFISINGNQVTGYNKIEWQINHPEQVKHFEVQHSVNGQSFETTASVKPTVMTSYHWIDTFPLQGTNYYRVKASMPGGSFIYSPVVKLGSARTGFLEIYPNPVTGNRFTISMKGLPKGDYTLKIINAVGQVLHTRRISLNSYDHSALLQVPFITTGNYHLVLTGASMQLHRPFTL